MQFATQHHRSQLSECVLIGACGVALIAILPILAFALFMLRPIAVLAAVLAIVAVASPWVIAPRLKGRWGADVAPEHAYQGLRLARDVGIHPGHGWVWIGDGEALIGADDLAQSDAGSIDSIEILAGQGRVVQGEPAFRLRHGDRALDIPAPISGTILGTNPRLHDQPGLVNSRPFSLGWVMRLGVDDDRMAEERRSLRFGRSAWRWFREEVDSRAGATAAVLTPHVE